MNKINDKQEKKISVVPENYSAVTPWIISPSTERQIDFIVKAFVGELIPNSIIKNEQGAIIHAVAKIGDAMINLFDSKENWAPTPTFLNLYVSDVEKAYNDALDLGAKSVTDITTLWFGEKVCRILDPFGNLWWLNERVEEVDFTDMETIQARATMPDAIAGIVYIQSSLNDAMLAQKNFFAKK